MAGGAMIRGNRGTVDRSITGLAEIAARHNLDPGKFFDRIVEAWNQGRSKCDRLKITCRGKGKDSAVFLFTIGSDIIGQFPIPTKVLEGKNQIEAYVGMVSLKGRPVQREMNVRTLKIEDLRPKMSEVSLRAKVLETPEPRVVHTRLGPSLVSNVLIGDETGTMRLVLWNRQIDTVSEGALIEIRNARVSRFRGELLLRVDRHSEIKRQNEGGSDG